MNENDKINRRRMVTGLAAGALTVPVVAAAARPTPANPEGPFYPVHEQLDKDTDLTHIAGHEERANGEVIRVTGQVVDESGKPVPDALVDIWQANAAGRYQHEKDPATAPLDPNFQGWGMVRTDAEGRFSFLTIKPGAYAVNGDWSRPPHIHFKVARRGYHELTTQMYFSGEKLNESDRLLQSVDAVDRPSLVVEFSERGGVPEGHFPIVLATVA